MLLLTFLEVNKACGGSTNERAGLTTRPFPVLSHVNERSRTQQDQGHARIVRMDQHPLIQPGTS